MYVVQQETAGIARLIWIDSEWKSLRQIWMTIFEFICSLQYLLSSSYMPSLRAPRERRYGFIISSFFTERYQSAVCWY